MVGGHVVLVGMMGTGKTTVGNALAERLGLAVLDSDDQVEASTGRTVREIWRTDGEATFRALEAEALSSALSRTEPVVVAAAGGVVLSEANRDLLRDSGARVVWLRARPATVLDRLERTDDTHRPLLDDDPAGTLERMATDRAGLYDAVADVAVDVDGRTPEAVTDEICRRLGEPA